MEPKPLCGAKRSNGETCRMLAGYGTPHLGRGPCKRHMGCTPAVVQKYITEEALENARAAGEVGPLYRGEPVAIHPHEALLGEVRRTAGRVQWLDIQARVEKDEELAVRLDRELFKERQHLVVVCSVAARAGVEERAIKLAEMWGQELRDALQAILSDLNLSPEQRRVAPEVVRRHLVAIEGQGA